MDGLSSVQEVAKIVSVYLNEEDEIVRFKDGFYNTLINNMELTIAKKISFKNMHKNYMRYAKEDKYDWKDTFTVTQDVYSSTNSTIHLKVAKTIEKCMARKKKHGYVVLTYMCGHPNVIVEGRSDGKKTWYAVNVECKIQCVQVPIKIGSKMLKMHRYRLDTRMRSAGLPGLVSFCQKNKYGGIDLKIKH